MADEFVRMEVHQEFVARMKTEHQRLEDEDDRQNHRIDDLEESNKQIHDLALSIQELTSSVKTIATETERLSTMMEKNITDINTRLKKLEDVDGDKWRNVSGYVITAIISIVIGFVFSKIGM